jgi:STE24 endopeptidase
MAAAFTLALILALCLSLGLRAGLAWLNVRHITAHRSRVPTDFSSAIPLTEHQRAADYTIAKVRLSLGASLFDTLVILGFTLGGGLEALWRCSAQAFHAPLAQGSAFVALFALLSSLLGLPLSLFATFGIESRFGFNKMTLAMFCKDGLRSGAVGALIGLPLVALVLWLMQISGPLWWLWVWGVWAGFSLLMVALYPTVIAPLFNRFTPLQDLELKQQIEALLTRTGFKSQGIFVMDGSTRSSHGNAYFTGFGSAKRIVFFDTLLSRLSTAEIVAVLAHELGHFKKKHVVKRIALSFLLSLLCLFILGVLIRLPAFYHGMGLHSQTPAVALMLFFMVIPAFTFPLTPLASLMSRRHEFQADAFAAQQTDAHALISALVKLYRDNASTLTPDPLYSAFYDSHPPAAIRIAHLRELS